MERRWTSIAARQRYHEAVYAAEYYRWLAGKGFPLVGHCPFTGKEKSHYDPLHKGEGITAHKAIARFWLDKARHFRTNYTGPMP